MLTRTRIGLVIQSALTHPEMVEALGHNVPRVFMLVFGAGAALAGLAGVIGGSTFVTEPAMAGDGRLGDLRRRRRRRHGLAGRRLPRVAADRRDPDLRGRGRLLAARRCSQTLGITPGAALAGNSLMKLTVSQVAPILPYLFLVLILIFRPKGLLGTREG